MYSLELGLQMVLRHHADVDNQSWALCKSSFLIYLFSLLHLLTFRNYTSCIKTIMSNNIHVKQGKFPLKRMCHFAQKMLFTHSMSTGNTASHTSKQPQGVTYYRRIWQQRFAQALTAQFSQQVIAAMWHPGQEWGKNPTQKSCFLEQINSGSDQPHGQMCRPRSGA